MRHWRTWLGFGAILGLANLVAGCAGTFASLSGNLPVPPRVEAPKLDQTTADSPVTLPEGFLWLSTPEEESIAPYLGLTKDAWERILKYAEDLRRGYCEGRFSLERANGRAPEDIPLCRTGPAKAEPQTTSPDFSQPKVYPLAR